MSGDNHHRNPPHNLIQRSYDGCCREFRQTDTAIKSRSGYVCLFERIEYEACCKSLDRKAERKHRHAVKNTSLYTEMIGEIATHAMTPTILKIFPSQGGVHHRGTYSGISGEYFDKLTPLGPSNGIRSCNRPIAFVMIHSFVTEPDEPPFTNVPFTKW